MSKVKTVLYSAAAFFIAYAASRQFVNSNSTDITKNSVMIVNKAMNHGGTGIVYESTSKGSLVLTNDHVCKAVKTGGVVKTSTSMYQIQAVLESQVSDLCLVFVPSNLNQQTKLADNEPKTFTPAKVSGHPALMPTVITTGHFSERQIIQVFTGITPCTAEEVEDPDTSLLCGFFGGIPTIKSYESILVSATIMPGSSGSGVYNSSNELSGVVFAGQGDLGYAWTVPYDQVKAFLFKEAPTGKFENIDQTVHMFEKQDTNKNIKEVLQKCSNVTDVKLVNLCRIIKNDVMWVR